MAHDKHHGHDTHGIGFALIPLLPGGRFFLLLFALIVMCGGT